MSAGGGIIIDLGWPDKVLWPNGGHGHYMKVHRFKKAARIEAGWATKLAIQGKDFEHDGGEIPIHIVAHPKTANAVDKQNLIASLKAHFDGIADVLEVDDKHFAAPTVEWADPVPHGKLIVRVS